MPDQGKQCVYCTIDDKHHKFVIRKLALGHVCNVWIEPVNLRTFPHTCMNAGLVGSSG